MMWHAPSWLELVLLAGLVFRLCRLAGWDDITATIRGRLTIPDAFYPHVAAYVDAWRSAAGDPWHPQHEVRGPHIDWMGRIVDRSSAMMYPNDERGEPRGYLVLDWPMPSPRRFYAAQLVRCPWCAGFWLSLLVTAAWCASPSATLCAGMIGTLSTIAGLVRKHLDQ